MSDLRLEHVTCYFPGGTRAVDDVCLELAAGELFCLLGASGCGKSTLLRLIGGYLKPDAGRVWIGGREVTHAPPERRNAGMVFQNYALFPHLTALDNVAFGLRVQGMSKSERLARAHERLDWVGLTAVERQRRPSRLSGGQQQRVALARALAFNPSLLMLDEPFANLDRLLRERLREEIKQVQRRAGITTILVTHDREEAFALGDRIAVMHAGRLLQMGKPEAVHRQPASRAVAEFLGHRNVLPMAQAGAIFQLLDTNAGGDVLLWPERLRLHAEAGAGRVAGQILKQRFTGERVVLTAEFGADATALEVHQPLNGPAWNDGDAVWLEAPAAAFTVVGRKENVA